MEQITSEEWVYVDQKQGSRAPPAGEGAQLLLRMHCAGARPEEIQVIVRGQHLMLKTPHFFRRLLLSEVVTVDQVGIVWCNDVIEITLHPQANGRA